MMRAVFTLTCLTATIFFGMLPSGVYALTEGQCEVFGGRGLLDAKTLKNECCQYESQKTAPHCAPACDKALADRYMAEYQRKKEIGLELLRHSGELNLDAKREVLEFLDIEAKRYGWEAASDRALDKGWDSVSPAVKWHLEQSKWYMQKERSKWAAKLAEYAPNASGAAAKGMNLGNYVVLVEGVYRAFDISGRYDKYQKESKKAAEEGQRLLEKALAELEAALKQAPACLEASRKAAADEKLLDEAKAQIEAWESNGYLYRDPITSEALDYRAALQRALDRLKGAPSRGAMDFLATAFPFFSPAYAANLPGQEVSVTKSQLQDALKDFDHAIRVFDVLRGHVVSYLRVEAGVHAKLGEIAGSLAGK